MVIARTIGDVFGVKPMGTAKMGVSMGSVVSFLEVVATGVGDSVKVRK